MIISSMDRASMLQIESLRARTRLAGQVAQIGMSNRVRGRLGNYLFHINLLLQVARLEGFKPKIPPYKYSTCVRVRERFQTGFLDESAHLVSGDLLLGENGGRPLALAEHWKSLGKDISIPSLDSPQEIFVPFSFLDPTNFFRIQRQNLVGHNKQLSRFAPRFFKKNMRLGLHFRGTDFRDWDSSALMPEKFFHEGVASITERWGHQDFQIEIFTDDPSAPVVQRLVRRGALFRPRTASQDFRALSEMDAIVASPSTFSFWAAMLGGKKIVFQRAWVSRRAMSGSHFWTAALRNQLPHIEVHTV